MDELVAWLRQQLDEDERVGRIATRGPWRYNPRKQWNVPPLALGVQPEPEEYVAAGPLDAPLCVAATGPADHEQSMADAKHIARWDPARVLAEVEAKRRILEAHDRPTHRCPIPVLKHAEGQMWDDGEPCWTLVLLAQPFADRPGFKDEWRLT